MGSVNSSQAVTFVKECFQKYPDRIGIYKLAALTSNIYSRKLSLAVPPVAA